MKINLKDKKYFVFKPTNEIFNISKNLNYEHEINLYDLLTEIQVDSIQSKHFSECVEIKNTKDNKYTFKIDNIFPEVYHSSKYDKEVIETSFYMSIFINVDFDEKTIDKTFKGYNMTVENVISTIDIVDNLNIFNKIFDDIFEEKDENLVFKRNLSFLENNIYLKEIASNKKYFYKVLEGEIEDFDFLNKIKRFFFQVNKLFFLFINFLYKYFGIHFYIDTKKYFSSLIHFSYKVIDVNQNYKDLYSARTKLFNIDDGENIFDINMDYFKELKSEKEIKNHLIDENFK